MKGVLLINLGTPEAPTSAAVGAYLREFLSDPKVVDLPRWLWLPLLNLVIVPLRRRRSAAAYREIWLDGGSPLLVNSQAIARKMQDRLGAEWTVCLAMRYGSPSIGEVLRKMRASGVDDLVVLPMYPQYSETTSGTVIEATEAALAALDWRPRLNVVRDYHDDAAWVAAIVGSIERFQARHGKPDMLLFSMHGIPQRYSDRGDPYRAQCYASIAAIAKRAGLDPDEYRLTFQSRFGREPWLQPYTDETLANLAGAGVRRVQVVCPGFAADCLETLEEIAIQNRELFQERGGEELRYIPALNDDDAHIGALAGLVSGPD